MLRNIGLILTLILNVFTSQVLAQEFDNFRVIGENVPSSAGFVTSISLPPETDIAQINFLNVAGLSKVYDVVFTPSESIRSNVPVFMPPPGFSDYQPPALDLQGVEFFSGTIVSEDGEAAPAHWFRMTRYEERWSGVFRIADRIYAISRDANNHVVEVRHTPSAQTIFQPSRRVKISAVIDQDYLFAAGYQNLGHLYALESIHVMDGLLADTLSMTVLLEQLIYQPANALTDPAQLFDLKAGASSWLQSNEQAFGLTDNLATLFFRQAINDAADSSNHPDSGLVESNLIIQGNTANYHFASAHYFGRLLGLFSEPLTLQDWTANGDVALTSAHWTERQKDFLNFNPPAASLTQILSYDAPEVATPPVEEIDLVDNLFVDSDSPEGANPPLLNDGETTNNADGVGGGGSSTPDFLWAILILAFGLRKTRRTTNAVNCVTRPSR